VLAEIRLDRDRQSLALAGMAKPDRPALPKVDWPAAIGLRFGW
jgi:hypothetical protein